MLYHNPGEYFAWTIAREILNDPFASAGKAETVVDGHKATIIAMAGSTATQRVALFGRTAGSPIMEEITATWMPQSPTRNGKHISVSLLPDSLSVNAPGVPDALHVAIQLLHALPETSWDPGLTISAAEDVRSLTEYLYPTKSLR